MSDGEPGTGMYVLVLLVTVIIVTPIMGYCCFSIDKSNVQGLDYKTVTVIDKWNNYYFADSEGTVYYLDYQEYTDEIVNASFFEWVMRGKKDYKKDNSQYFDWLRTRYNNIEINKTYTIKCRYEKAIEAYYSVEEVLVS